MHRAIFEPSPAAISPGPQRRLFARSLLLSALVLCAASARAEIVHMVCLMNGAQEPVSTDALGVGHFTVDTDANTMDYTIRYGGLSSNETAAHIHGFSDPGSPSSPVHTLPAGTLKTGTWNFSESDEPEILAGRTYVNVHSGNFGGGEIRGQIVHMVAFIDGSQEPTASTALGTGLFVLDTDANTLDYHIIYESDDLSSSETVAHIHGYARHGASALPVHSLPTGNPKTGTWNYDQADESAILDGLTYVNIHTVDNGPGEIRGQITRHLNFIDPEQETDSVTSSAYGVASFSNVRQAEELGFHITYTGLSSDELAAHIHGYAPLGADAPILFTLPTTNPKVGFWPYGGDLFGNLQETYVNIHTTNNGTGEIRGQFIAPQAIQVPVELGTFNLD